MDKRIVWAKNWSMKRVSVKVAPVVRERVGQCYCCGHYIYADDAYVSASDEGKQVWCQRCADEGAAW